MPYDVLAYYLYNSWLTCQMSLTADSPVHSSSSDDFAAFLDAELDSASDVSPDLDEVENEEAEGEEEVEDEKGQDEDNGTSFGDDDDDDSIDSSRYYKILCECWIC